MITNRGGLAHLKMFDMTNLLKRPVIVLDLPVLVMELQKRGTIESGPRLVIRLIQSLMAQRVFQPRPKHFDRAEPP
jgi:hypothetical protein